MRQRTCSVTGTLLRVSPVSERAGFPTHVDPSFMSRLLIPREHGAWGMVSLPFIAGALVAGNWANPRTLAAAVGVFSVFLMRPPLLVLWRNRNAVGNSSDPKLQASSRAGRSPRAEELQNARFSLRVYGTVAIVAGSYLFLNLPVIPLFLMSFGAAFLTLSSVYLAARNYQRLPALQIASALGLTASSLTAYLAARGHLESAAFWVWALFAAHSAASVLVVHARLESIIAKRKSTLSPAALPHRRDALVAQAGVLILLVVLVVQGHPWLILPFLPPLILEWWNLSQLSARTPETISLRQMGLMQLGASIAFCFLLVAVLRFSLF